MILTAFELLKLSPYTVTFRKKDGTERTILGFLPKWAERKNPEICPIFDLETSEWKSFREDSVLRMESEIGAWEGLGYDQLAEA